MTKINYTLIVFALVFTSCVSTNSFANWYRGNTHSHTTLSGHGDTKPDEVAQWYHDRGYQFLVLSEHNHYIDPKTVNIKNKRNDFILVPGLELTETVHSTALNVKEVMEPKTYWLGGWFTSIKDMIQSHVDRTNEKGGETILNHPNFGWTVKESDILGVNNLSLFELFNGHPSVHNHGDEKRASTEEMWDHLLSHNMVIYGVSSDDAHSFQAENISANKSNPGRGWVMVNAKSLTPDSITDALKQGKFYASNGVFLTACDSTGDYSISIDEEATLQELTSPLLRGKKVHEGKPGFKIEWITKDGKIVKTSHKLIDTFSDQFNTYLRPKVTYTRKLGSHFEEYYAWGQPKFK